MNGLVKGVIGIEKVEVSTPDTFRWLWYRVD